MLLYELYVSKMMWVDKLIFFLFLSLESEHVSEDEINVKMFNFEKWSASSTPLLEKVKENNLTDQHSIAASVFVYKYIWVLLSSVCKSWK